MSMLVVAAVLSVFAVFAIVLIWGDFQTRPAQRKPQWFLNDLEVLSRATGAAGAVADTPRLARCAPDRALSAASD